MINAKTDQLTVALSIPAYSEIVSKLAPSATIINILPAGQSPETYDVSPKKLLSVLQADIVVLAGMPYEIHWMKTLAERSHVKTVNLSENMHLHDHSNDNHHHHEVDPHTWLDLNQYLKHAEKIKSAIVAVNPTISNDINNRFNLIKTEVNTTYDQLNTVFSTCKFKKFLTYHAAWGHFASSFNIEQIAIENHGKTPSAGYLQKTLKQSELEYRALIAQTQTPIEILEPIADLSGLPIKFANPLSEKFLSDYEAMANVFVEAMGCKK